MRAIGARSFEELLSEAEAWQFSGWDFSSLGDRWVESPTPWDYRGEVLRLLRRSESLLDIGTGGGEFLSSLRPLPKLACATEGFPLNVPVARDRLGPLGIEILQTFSEDNSKTVQQAGLPFRAGCFSLIINRHASFVAGEVFRVLKQSGTFITEQVGKDNLVGLNRLLGADIPTRGKWDLGVAVGQLAGAGFKIRKKRAVALSSWFKDIGAVVCYLKAVPWQIPDFSVAKYINELRNLDISMRKQEGLKLTATRFLVEAVKPRGHQSSR